MESYRVQLENINQAIKYASGFSDKADNDLIAQQFMRGERESIWNLEQMKRGREIQNIFGRNLPQTFPVLTRFNKSIATVISSIDITLKTYQDGNNLYETIERDLRELSEKRAYSYRNINIEDNQILKKQYWLVIPENELKKEQEEALDRGKDRAKEWNIEFKLVRYESK